LFKLVNQNANFLLWDDDEDVMMMMMMMTIVMRRNYIQYKNIIV